MTRKTKQDDFIFKLAELMYEYQEKGLKPLEFIAALEFSKLTIHHSAMEGFK